MNDLLSRPDYPDFEKKVMNAHEKEIEGNLKQELNWWDRNMHFNSGLFAGRNDKIFLDSE